MFNTKKKKTKVITIGFQTEEFFADYDDTSYMIILESNRRQQFLNSEKQPHGKHCTSVLAQQPSGKYSTPLCRGEFSLDIFSPDTGAIIYAHAGTPAK